MKTAFLVALITAICLPQSLAAKPRKKKTPVDSVALMIDKHQWEGVNNYLFHEGTAVVEGRLVGFTETMPAGIVFNIKDLVLGKDDNQLLELDADGSVNGTVRLPHSQFCYVEGVNANMYVGVGDTLRFTYDASKPRDNRLTFMGTSTTTDVNRHWPSLREQFYGNKPWPYTVDLSTSEALYDYTAIYERMADSCMNLIAHDKLPLGEVTPLARDILHYGLINEALKFVLEAQMLYFFAVEDRETDKKDAGQNTDFVPFDSIRANRLFVRYEDMMLKTPLVLSSPQSWVVPNRMLFNQYKHLLQYARTYQIWQDRNVTYPQIEEDSLLIVNQWERVYTLPRHYRPGVAQYISQFTGRPCFSLSDHWREEITAIRAATGLGNNFMEQLKLCDGLAKRMLDGTFGDAPDLVAGYVAETLPFITHPVLSRRIIEVYRQWVVEHEVGAGTTKTSTITDPTLLSLLEPYKGSLLFVDFWNLGCGPCRASMLGQRDMVARIKQSGIPASVLYVSNDEGQRRTSAEEWLAENNIKGEHFFVTNDQWMKLRSVLNFSGIPFCIIVNADGTLHGNGESTHSYEFDTLLKEKFPAYKALME